MSEAMLTMVLDLDVARHKREMAEAFKSARERLIPPPKPTALEALYNSYMQNAACDPMRYANRLSAAQNQLAFYNQGGASFWGGLFGSPLGVAFDANCYNNLGRKSVYGC